MVSVRKEFVLIIDIPRKIYEAQKLGYTHFEADFTQDSRRVELRAWRRREKIRRRQKPKNFTPPWSNPSARRKNS